ncbi:MAG: lipocalin family protein [Thermomicrobiales bacterium]
MTQQVRFNRHSSTVYRGLVVTLMLLGINVAISPALAQEATPYVEPPPGQNDAPSAVTFPQDDGPHGAFIEWWYYTGHVFTETGDRYGFEQVVFKGAPNGVPGFASHAAITDSNAGAFIYDQKIAGPNAMQPGPGFNIVMGDWVMRGGGGLDRLRMEVPGYEMAIELVETKSPTLHDGDGFIDYGNRQGSYYYSRTRMAVTGTLVVDGERLAVTGEAWMDHQWGDFQTYDEGGWDWFSVQLSDGTDLMLYVIRGPDGEPVILDGSLVAADGALTILDGPDFIVDEVSYWTSPATDTTYPMGWQVKIPDENLVLSLKPTLPSQELDTTATTGVIYWEGEVVVSGTRHNLPVDGLGYVELTGYAD